MKRDVKKPLLYQMRIEPAGINQAFFEGVKLPV
jgi:hypothetical protein